MQISKRNNIIAGAFLISSVVLGVAVSAVLSDITERFVPKNTYIIEFGLADGATGIVPGSTVLVGGREAGRVTKVEFANADGADPDKPASLLVEIRLPTSIALYENAIPTLAQPLIGSMSAINIVDLGAPDGVDIVHGSSSRLEPGESLQGRLAPPSFLAAAGFGPDQSQSVKRIIASAETTIERLDTMTLDFDVTLRQILANFSTTADDIEIIVADIRTREPEWADRIDHSLERFQNAADEANFAIEDLRAGITEADGLITDARETLSVNRPKLDRIVDNVETTTARLNTESLELLNEALASADTTAEELAELATEANLLLAEYAPAIRRTLSNVRLASDQLKLTLIEVRRNPWRLLYRPGAKETQTEVLYDAARAYAVAVSDLRAASESLEAASARVTPNSEEVQALMAALQDAFSRFEQTERDLLDRLLRD